MSKRYTYVVGFLHLMFTMLLLGCSKEKPITDEIAERMVLVYLAANNDLQIEAINSIKKMQAGANGLNGVLLVFVKTNSLNSHLIKIKYSKSSNIVSDTIRSYTDENSSDPLFLRRVIDDARKLQPARNYGLVLWSHATSWSPPSDRMGTKSFGHDDDLEMDIKELSTVLPSDFEYIMFDACSMASIEVIYELRKKTKYILASPAEVLSTGFPYDEITPFLFGGLQGLKLVSQKFIDHYSSLPGLYASATVSLTDTKELEALALLTKELLETQIPAADFNIHNLQKLDFQAGSGVPPAYDFISFLENNYEPLAFMPLKAQVGRAVVYEGHTSSFFNIPITSFCGITVYVPQNHDAQFIRDYYSTLAWAKDSGWNRLFTRDLLDN